MTLREFLYMVAGCLPDEYSLDEKWEENSLSDQKVRLKFEYKGSQASVVCPVDHPLLIPIYDAKVCGVEADNTDLFGIWIKTDKMEQLLKGKKDE